MEAESALAEEEGRGSVEQEAAEEEEASAGAEEEEEEAAAAAAGVKVGRGGGWREGREGRD